MKTPVYFVQTIDHTLWAYWSVDVLLCDLAANRDLPVTLFELQPGVKVSYKPITEAEIRLKRVP